MSETKQTPIQDLVQILRPHRLLVVICVAVAVALALGLSATQEKRYRATAALAFDNLSEDFAVVGSVGGVAEPPSSLALRKSQTLLNTKTLEGASEKLADGTTVSELRRRVTAAPEVTSNLVLVTAESKSAVGAAATANAVATIAAQRETAGTRLRFSRGARELRRRYAALPAADRADAATRASYRERISRLDALASVASPVRLDDRARVPDSASSPRPVQAGVVAAFAGLLIGLALAFGRNALDRRLRGIDAIRAALDIPFIGQVREEAMGTAGMAHPDAPALSEIDLEGFRILRANLEFLTDGNATTLLVTSPLPEEGKSTVAASLAWASAMSGRRTLLVECDLRRPTLAARLGLVSAPGLVEVLSGDATIDDVTHVMPKTASSNGARPQGAAVSLACVLAGGSVADPAALLGSDRFSAFLSTMSSAYDVVILDSAPLLPVVDTLELFASVDAAILCIRDGRTSRDQAMAARELLNNLDDRPVALVVTGLKRAAEAGYGYYYSHSYASK